MYEHIYGIVPPMTTPFRPDGTIDEDALRAETHYMIEVAKVHGLARMCLKGHGIAFNDLIGNAQHLERRR